MRVSPLNEARSGKGAVAAVLMTFNSLEDFVSLHA